MSLQTWQSTLAELIVTQGRSSAVLDAKPDLSTAERAWFDTLPTSSGFLMTCAVQRWWRTLAVADSAPLALGLLHAFGRTDLFTDYLDEQCEASLFPLPDGLRFLDFLIAHAAEAGVPHLEAVATFERALLRLTRAAALNELSVNEPSESPDTLNELSVNHTPAVDAERPLARHPLAEVVQFRAPPEEVLSAIMDAQRPPDEAGNYWLLLAPRLPHFSRLATSAENALLNAVTSGPTRAVELDPEAMATLWLAGALVYSDA